MNSTTSRIKLADALLKTREWVEDQAGGGGDEDKAITRLEEDAFGDIVGVVSLPELLDVFHHVPDIADWRKHRFNLKKIWADWKSRQRPRPSAKPQAAPASNGRKPLTPPNQLEDMTPGQAKAEYQRAYSAHESDAQKIVRLETRVKALEAENASLKQEVGRLKSEARELFKIAN